jgi:type II secretory pathway component GspD/PulD (secretin)
MSAKIRCSLIILAPVALALALALAVRAQPRATKGDDAKTRRVAYVVQHGSAKSLAESLGKHFKKDAVIEAASSSTANVLLISADAAVFDEVLATLAKLDRKPQLVTIELFVLNVPPPKGGDGKLGPADKEIDEKELSGAAAKVLAQIQALGKRGVGLKRYQLTAVEQQQTKMITGETFSYVTGMTAGGKGAVVRTTHAYKNVGTSVILTPRVAADKTVTLDLNVEESWPHQPEDAPILGMDDSGRPVRPTNFVHSKLDGSVIVPDGQAVLVSGVQTLSKKETGRTLIVVTAGIVP